MKSAVLVCVCLFVCKICQLILFFFFLFSFVKQKSMYVLVFGIKQEEQHANTSANYDVELLHHRDAHLEFFKSGEYITIEIGDVFGLGATQ